MRHEYAARALGELLEIGKAPSGPAPVLQHAPEAFDVIVTTHKTIDLVFHTQIYKLKRDMTRPHAVSASSDACMPNDGMKVNDESPAYPPTANGGRPTPGGAPPQRAQAHAGTPGRESWKSHSMLESQPVSNNTKAPSRVNGARSSTTCSPTDGRSCQSMNISMLAAATPVWIAPPWIVYGTQRGAAR